MNARRVGSLYGLAWLAIFPATILWWFTTVVALNGPDYPDDLFVIILINSFAALIAFGISLTVYFARRGVDLNKRLRTARLAALASGAGLLLLGLAEHFVLR